MIITANTNTSVAIYDGEPIIVDFLRGDSIEIDSPKEVERLLAKKEMGKPVFLLTESDKKVPSPVASDIHAAYFEKFDKPVPNNKKNDEEWIKNKLNAE